MSLPCMLNFIVNVSLCGLGGWGGLFNCHDSPTTPMGPICGENEVYSESGNNECQNTCENPYLSQICKGPCIPGCICQEGYLLNSNRECVHSSECVNYNDTCGENQYLNPCPQYCTFDKTCQELIFGFIRDCPPPPPDYTCVPTCYCKPGFLRINGLCRPSTECCSDPNEEFVQCPNPCPGGTCNHPEFSPCKAACQPYGCQCRDGYVRDSNHTCIPLSECVDVCGKNEVWNPSPPLCSTELSCDQVLTNTSLVGCTAPTEGASVEPAGRCECISGYVRKNGLCVQPSECCADPNAEFVSCPNPCPGGTCQQPEFSACDLPCQPQGCQCKKGYLKNDQGICVLASECTSVGNETCGENEVWNKCRPWCVFDQSCDGFLLGISPICIPQPVEWICHGECECKEGYVRVDGKCQLPSACCKDSNSHLVQCPNPCLGGTCLQPNFDNCSLPCKDWGCVCKDGFVKNIFGECIPLESCVTVTTPEVPKKCGEHELYNPCPNDCLSEGTCAQLLDNFTPPPCNISDIFPAVCNPAKCECIKPFVRNNHGECVRPNECCTDPNADFVHCPNPCPGGTCQEPLFELCPEKCKPWGCQCKLGYVKNDQGICIPVKDCPAITFPVIPTTILKCGEHELYNPCPVDCLPEESCSDILEGVTPPPCNISIAPHVCKPKCECIKPFVRNNNGVCVPRDQCCADPNALLISCPNPCPGGTCEKPLYEECFDKCKPWGCQCKLGYVKNSNGTCIPLTDCEGVTSTEPPSTAIKCGKHEVYNPCPLKCLPEESCSGLEKGKKAPACDVKEPNECQPKCECLKPFVRNKQGECVLRAECCSDPNAVFLSCPNPCRGGTCKIPYFDACTKKCKPWGCQCKLGNVKNKDGKCIPLFRCTDEDSEHEPPEEKDDDEEETTVSTKDGGESKAPTKDGEENKSTPKDSDENKSSSKDDDEKKSSSKEDEGHKVSTKDDKDKDSGDDHDKGKGNDDDGMGHGGKGK